MKEKTIIDLKHEYAELSERQEQLSEFIDCSDEFHDLGFRTQLLLIEQFETMDRYSKILAIRIREIIKNRRKGYYETTD